MSSCEKSYGSVTQGLEIGNYQSPSLANLIGGFIQADNINRGVLSQQIECGLQNALLLSVVMGAAQSCASG